MNKKTIEKVLLWVVFANAAVFLMLAYLEKLSTEPRALIFIDFWGRLCVYSLWFVGYALYRKFVVDHRLAKTLVVSAVWINIPLFLGLAYLDKLSPDPKALPFIDFWGRLTVYSVWFMAYEFYREYIQEDSIKSRVSRPSNGDSGVTQMAVS